MWKLSSRPCQNQYPLKKEAVDGIKPVHEALHKGGVIVSCENSPVRTPIFPVKKIKPVGQPDEWRSDLQEVPLQNADLELFVDGSASRDPGTGKNQTGFAVTTLHDIVLAEPLPSNYSAQAADLVALRKACTLAKDKSVNIFTDSRYAWGVCHSFGQIWANRKFLTASGKPIAHHTLVASARDSSQGQVSVRMKCCVIVQTCPLFFLIFTNRSRTLCLPQQPTNCMIWSQGIGSSFEISEELESLQME
ncbi:uncharacterized protein LOC119005007 isoform X3 [Acanthopagrus latus]|uniref:uncharacterized protein LOC119005007 isoform X3 n=1 Tax=Acanthopagrus latus TaxID=8177 RepID=UPI00187BF7A0|nr:uncharacterized protein LOC119005007 isoform X3 [Acanthopagrus latus]